MADRPAKHTSPRAAAAAAARDDPHDVDRARHPLKHASPEHVGSPAELAKPSRGGEASGQWSPNRGGSEQRRSIAPAGWPKAPGWAARPGHRGGRCLENAVTGLPIFTLAASNAAQLSLPT